jgi:peptide/nickel transport system substrate-binding protein
VRNPSFISSLRPLRPLCSLCGNLLFFSLFFLSSCSRPASPDPSTLTFVIESNPANLDPRFGSDAQSQRLSALLFDGLVERDAEMNLHPDLAESWDTPTPLTYIFHLRKGILFHDGRPVTSSDVKSTIDFMRNPANRSPKRGAFRMINTIEAPDSQTVIFHLNEPSASFLWNLERSAVGIIPADAPSDFSRHPIGSGPFRFVSQSQDDAVILESNPNYFRGAPKLHKVIFRIVPDTIVRALELRKGSADLELSSLSPDMIPVLARQPALLVSQRPGTNFTYLGINMEDPILSKREVRQALAYATDRDSLIKFLLHDEARKANSLLPPNHWAHDATTRQYNYDPAQAEKLLDAAGYPRKADGTRLHVTLKISTEEQARLIGAALQDQWKKVGISLEVRPLEIATLFADLAKGSFQISYLRWVGANNDPDVFELVFNSKRIPPDGPNRGRYRSVRMDALTDQIRTEMDREKRKQLCYQAQQLAAEDLPYIPLWYPDVVSVHAKRLGDLPLSPTGDYQFLSAP